MTAGVTIVNSAKVFVDWMDMSGQENELSLPWTCDEIPSNAFNVGAHVSVPGLEKFSVSHKGYLAFGLDSIEEKIAALKGLVDIPVTLSKPGASGDPCYFMKAAQLQINRSLPMGQAAGFDMSMAPSALTVIKGVLLESASVKSTNGSGTARLIGAASATQKIYAVLHVLEVTGTPTLNVIIESDTIAGMSTPITKVTFAAKTARGSEFVTPVSGPNTDTYYRASWTISGGTATIAVGVGIL